MVTRSGSTAALVGGLVLILLGGVFLLRNAGLLDVDWRVVWPVILVAVGIVVILGAVRGTSRGTGDPSVVVPVDGAISLELALRLGAGVYTLAGGAASLVEATSDEPTIRGEVSRDGGRARVRLSTAVDPFVFGWTRGVRWRIGVARDVPTVLDLQAGAGTFEIDLSSVPIVSASMSVGAADLKVVLPRPRGEVPVRIDGGASSLAFRIPAGVEARVATTGLVTATGPRETPGYGTARDRVTVTVTGGVASVRVVQG